MQHTGPHRGPPPPPPLAMPNRYAQPSNPYALPTIPLPSPRMERDAEGFLIMDEPPSVSTKYDGREWSLEVPQQPIRARMCGFGDKVYPVVVHVSHHANAITGPETHNPTAMCQTDCEGSDDRTGDRCPVSNTHNIRFTPHSRTSRRDIDISFFVITVDLWDEEAQKEVNLVKHAANSPSISTASAVAYPQTPTATVSNPIPSESVLEANLPQSASQSYYQFPQSNYTSPAGAQQQSPASPYYQPHAQQGYGGVQANYGQYGHTQYGFNHSSFGPNNSHSNAQYLHTTQALPPSHPAYLVGPMYPPIDDVFGNIFPALPPATSIEYTSSTDRHVHAQPDWSIERQRIPLA
jgi:Velvet factor